MLISLFKTSFDHFQFRPTSGMTSIHYLTVCRIYNHSSLKSLCWQLEQLLIAATTQLWYCENTLHICTLYTHTKNIALRPLVHLLSLTRVLWQSLWLSTRVEETRRLGLGWAVRESVIAATSSSYSALKPPLNSVLHFKPNVVSSTQFCLEFKLVEGRRVAGVENVSYSRALPPALHHCIWWKNFQLMEDSERKPQLWKLWKLRRFTFGDIMIRNSNLWIVEVGKKKSLQKEEAATIAQMLSCIYIIGNNEKQRNLRTITQLRTICWLPFKTHLQPPSRAPLLDRGTCPWNWHCVQRSILNGHVSKPIFSGANIN